MSEPAEMALVVHAEMTVTHHEPEEEEVDDAGRDVNSEPGE